MPRLLAAAGMIGLVLAGCGKNDDPAVGGTATTTEPGTATTVAAAKDVVGITLAEYSFTVDATLKAGGTVKVTNAGKEFHMLGVGKFKDGKTLADLQAALAKPPPEGQGEGERDDPTKDVLDEVSQPSGIFGPGQTAAVTAPNFGAGEYALICFIPTEGPEGTPHFAKGMVGTLKVDAAKAPEPTADATYNLAPGKAITGPATLTAGRHVLRLQSAPGSKDLEPVLAKADVGKTIADMDIAFDSFESKEGFALPVGAADKIPGKVIAGLFDLGENPTLYLTVDLTPGTYTLGAQDSDVKDAPSDPVEKILIKVS